jgi:predicted component of type VI protein secretion system
MAMLRVLLGGQELNVYRLDQTEITVGRDQNCPIWIDNLALSRRHFQIRQTPQGHIVRDLGSANGTYLNGEPIEERLLRHDDHLTVGKFVLVYIADGHDAGISYWQASPTGGSKAGSGDGIDRMLTYENVTDAESVRQALAQAEAAEAAESGKTLDEEPTAGTRNALQPVAPPRPARNIAMVPRAKASADAEQMRMLLYAAAGIIVLLVVVIAFLLLRS